MRFRNPPGSPAQTAGASDFVPFFLRRAGDRTRPEVPPGHVLSASEARAGLAAAGPESLTWLGHACFLVRTGGLTILTDPFLSDYASPFAGLGPKRYVPPGLRDRGSAGRSTRSSSPTITTTIWMTRSVERDRRFL